MIRAAYICLGLGGTLENKRFSTSNAGSMVVKLFDSLVHGCYSLYFVSCSSISCGIRLHMLFSGSQIYYRGVARINQILFHGLSDYFMKKQIIHQQHICAAISLKG